MEKWGEGKIHLTFTHRCTHSMQNNAFNIHIRIHTTEEHQINVEHVQITFEGLNKVKGKW